MKRQKTKIPNTSNKAIASIVVRTEYSYFIKLILFIWLLFITSTCTFAKEKNFNVEAANQKLNQIATQFNTISKFW